MADHDLPADEFQQLLERVRSGSDDAARELLEQYGGCVIRTIRRQFNRRLRTRFDTQDFAQAVWASVFENREKLDFQTPGSLVAFLITVSKRRVMYEFRRHVQGAGRNVNRERPMQNSSFVAPLIDERMETPSQLAIARETWARMTEGQPSRYRRIMELRCNGESIEDIAEQVGVNERTVRRVIRRLTEGLEA